MPNGQIALVTGATRGIGQAIALTLGKLGATVVGTATSETGAGAISDYLAAAGVKGRGAMLEVRDGAMVESLVAAVDQEFGPVTILVTTRALPETTLPCG